MRQWTLRMAPEPPEHYVDFVERHLSALTSEAARLVGDDGRADLVYPDALEDVAARWSWLELQSAFGGRDAREAYLRRSLTTRARRWRDQQLYEVEVRPLEPGEPRPVAAAPVPAGPPAEPPGVAVVRYDPLPYQRRPDHDPEPADHRLYRRPPVDRPTEAPGTAAAGASWPSAGRPGPAGDSSRPGHRSGNDDTHSSGDTDWGDTGSSGGTGWPGTAGWPGKPAGPGPSGRGARRPVWVSVALRRAELVGDTVRAEARPVAEAAIAWWHAYERHRRYRRGALVVAAVLFLVLLARVGDALATG